MSAFRAVRVGDHAGHDHLLEDRDGAGDEGTGSAIASDGEEDHVVASGRDPGNQRSAHAALARTLFRSTAMTGCSIAGGADPVASENSSLCPGSS